MPQSMEGPCPAAELWPGQGKAAALESYLDGIKIRTMAEEKVRSLRTAETESSKSPETIAWLISWSRRLDRGEQGRSGGWLGQRNPEPEKILDTRGKE